MEGSRDREPADPAKGIRPLAQESSGEALGQRRRVRQKRAPEVLANPIDWFLGRQLPIRFNDYFLGMPVVVSSTSC
jgi:hypothetical protein